LEQENIAKPLGQFCLSFLEHIACGAGWLCLVP